MTEKQLHKSICIYIKTFYPKVLFNSDLSGLRMTYGQAKDVKHLRSSNGFPDLVIYEPKNNYAGLFIELKIETPYKKNGNLKSNTHLQEQAEMLSELEKRGFKAVFGWSFDMVKDIIDNYLL